MSDLVKQLWAWAKRDTAMSEFGPDEHIAGIAADEIERLRKERDVWKANAETNLGEVDSLIELLRREKVKVERLRGALERIAELYYPAEIQRIAREVLDE